VIGRTLSHYRIQAEISRGGMGVVYRAFDTKLEREVAVKVLPPELVADESRRRRFVQEAKAAASVHHPHIATIHEIDEAEGVHFIAMELIEGEKLSELLGRERLSVSRTLGLVREIAEGLSKAHEKHVVHRDLKPANVMVSRDGHVKIIDFGLAKLVEPLRPLAMGESEAETATLQRETDPGQILGTVSYMSPEQARGEAVDHRSDIFSFGVVLYEMLSGKLPFRGKTGTDTLTAILRDPAPRLSGVENAEELQHVVNRCLAKDPEERYQTTKDLLADIRRVQRDTESGVRVAAKAPRRRALWGVVAATVIAAGLLVVFWPRGPEPFVPRVGRTIQVTREPGLELDAAISPDGKLVAYAAGPRHTTRIYVRQVAGGRPVPLSEDLAGTHRSPHWSPDGTRIFFRNSRPGVDEGYIVPALGGAPRRFPAPGDLLELIWSPGGERIAFISPGPDPGRGAIFVGSEDTGEAKKLADASEPWSLSWSPDGRRLAFTSGNFGYFLNLNIAPSSIWVVDAESGASSPLTDDGHRNVSPVWTPDSSGLLFVSDRGGGRDIYRMSLDPEGRPLGAPERLTTGLDVFTIALSADGRTLAYSVANLRQNIWSLAVPTKGPISIAEARPVTTGNQVIDSVGVSPDGKWLAFGAEQGGRTSLLRMPVAGTEPVELMAAPTFGMPSWSPDGKEIAFHAFSRDNRDIFVISAEGGSARQITNHPAHEFYPNWSPDGTRLIFQSGRTGVSEIYSASKDRGELSGETPAQLTSNGEAIVARFSPDGRLIAYEGANGISLIPSEGGPSRRLTDFGSRPLWSKDGKAIYFLVGGHDERAGMWSASLSGGELERLVRFDDPFREFYFDWTGDGENFYFMLAEFEADVWVMELEESTK